MFSLYWNYTYNKQLVYDTSEYLNLTYDADGCTVKPLLLNTPPKWSTCYTERRPVPGTNFTGFRPLLNDHLVILNVNAFFRSLPYKSTSIIWTATYGAIYLSDNISHLISSSFRFMRERNKWLYKTPNRLKKTNQNWMN